MDNTVDRVLRTIQVYSFIIGLGLLVAYGARSGEVTLPLGVIPACFSAVVGLVGLGGGLKRRAVAIPFDGVLLAFHIGIFIPSIIYLTGIRAEPSTTVLGAYASMPLLADICCHAYCILRHLPLPGFRSTTTCPNCQHEHTVNPHLRFASTMWAPSTIFTPEDNEDGAPLTHDYDNMTVGRASNDLDGATVIGGEPRLNQPPTGESKGNGRLF